MSTTTTHTYELPDAENPDYIHSLTHSKLLAQIIEGKIDPVLLAKQELANRGLDLKGKWIGFDAAEKLYGLTK